MPEGEQPGQQRGVFLLSFAGVLLAMLAGYAFRGQLQSVLVLLQGWVTTLGPAAAPAMAVVCGVWGTLCLPGPLMQATVGTMFALSPLTGVAVVLTGEALAQATAFTVARFFGRDQVRNKLQDKPWFSRLEAETERRGTYGVFLFRLMPFCPNALGSYAFGLTSLHFWPYMLASVVGSAPKMFVYIYGTTSVVNLVRSGALGPRELAACLVGIVLLYLCGRGARAWWMGRRGGQL